jgi:predicted Zn-dependent peptidase
METFSSRHLILTDHVTLHLQKAPAFKSVLISMRFSRALDPRIRPARLLLSYLWPESSPAYPTKRSLEIALDQMYGADLSTSQECQGGVDALKLNVRAAADRYVKEDVLTRQVHLCAALLPRELSFSKAHLDECRRQAAMALGQAMEDPGTYTLHQALKHYGGAPARLLLPSPAALMNVSEEQVRAAYRDMLAEDRIDLIVTGDMDPDRTIQLVQENFSFASRNPKLHLCQPSRRRRREVFTESGPFSQSTLVQIYRTDTIFTQPAMPALMLANGLLGALPASLLFQEVREKHGYCYEISSENRVYEGTLFILTSMDASHVEETRALIAHQIQRLQEGDFPVEDLETARRLYIASWRGSRDSLAERARELYIESLLGYQDINAPMLAAFSRVTKEDIQQAARRLSMKVEYIVQGDSHGQA